MRLIDADAFADFIKNAIKTQRCDALKVNDAALSVGDVLESVVAELEGTSLDGFKNNPTIEAQRIKGRWEVIEDWDGDDLYRCSECLSMFTLIDGTPEDNDYNFCPCCGAWMLEEPYKGEQG